MGCSESKDPLAREFRKDLPFNKPIGSSRAFTDSRGGFDELFTSFQGGEGLGIFLHVGIGIKDHLIPRVTPYEVQILSIE